MLCDQYLAALAPVASTLGSQWTVERRPDDWLFPERHTFKDLQFRGTEVSWYLETSS